MLFIVCICNVNNKYEIVSVSVSVILSRYVLVVGFC